MQRILTTREKLENALDQLATLRDDVRVRAHLAGLDACEAFQRIDAELHRELSQEQALTSVLTDIARRLRDLRTSLRQ